MKDLESGLEAFTKDIRLQVENAYAKSMVAVTDEIVKITGVMLPSEFEEKFEIGRLKLPIESGGTEGTVMRRAVILADKQSEEVMKVFIIEAGYRLNLDDDEMKVEIFATVENAPTDIVERVPQSEK